MHCSSIGRVLLSDAVYTPLVHHPVMITGIFKITHPHGVVFSLHKHASNLTLYVCHHHQLRSRSLALSDLEGIFLSTLIFCIWVHSLL